MTVSTRVKQLMDSGTNAVVAFDPGFVEDQLAGGKSGPLKGVSLAVKDNICTDVLPTTCASALLDGYVSPFEATVVTRAREAGAIVSCKTNMDEFGMGSSNEHSAFGACLHPTDPERVPGGSSGGSAVAVASGHVDVALGSDTGGSVRQPAAFCGVVGYKPTYGRVSRYGLVAFGSSLDQIGVLGPTTSAVGEVARVISGHDPYDATSHGTLIGSEEPDTSSVRVGVPQEYFADLDPEVEAACRKTLGVLQQAGYDVVDVSLPHTDLALSAYYVIAPAEASANLARFDGVRYGARGAGDTFADVVRSARTSGLGPEVKRRILTGTYVLSAGYADQYYARALATRALVTRDFEQAFSKVDLLFTPTTPEVAFLRGSRVDNPVAMYSGDRFVVGANLAGVPALSLPIGRNADGLPIGGQLMASSNADGLLLFHAGELERLLGN